MNHKEIKSRLEKRYPGRAIIEIPPSDPKEIILETEVADNFSRAIAVIEKSEPHFHRKMTEVYTILEGNLTLYMDGVEKTLAEGDRISIKSGVVHWAKGDPAWVQVDCYPAWSEEDHILV